MSMQPSIAARTHQRAVEHVALIERYAADGKFDPWEITDLERSARDMARYTHATHCTGAVSQAVNRATNARTLHDLMRMAERAIDELPDEAA